MEHTIAYLPSLAGSLVLIIAAVVLYSVSKKSKSTPVNFGYPSMPTGTQYAAPKPHPYKIGQNYFIRTVTFHYTGRLTAVYDQELVLENAAWIPDDGRFSDALKNADAFNEVEPYPAEEPVVIGRGAIVDGQVYLHPLPTKQK